MNIMLFDTYKFVFLIHKLFYPRMIEMSLRHYTLSSVGFLHHQIHR
jgi:hypothetical protein